MQYNASDTVRSLIPNRSILRSMLFDYFNDFDAEIVDEAIKIGTPWTLLTIFLSDGFSGDFPAPFACPNNLICWHLTAIADALRARSIELKDYYGPEFTQPFFYTASLGYPSGQGKLFYSLLYFVMSNAFKGHTKMVEAGAGVDEGGKNHLAVATILNTMGVTLELTMIDPMHSSSVTTDGTVTFNHKNGYVIATDKFEDPVFCDIYDEGNWSRIQRELVAPNKMLKSIFGYKGPNILLQPYHTEVRIFQNNQLPFLLYSFCRPMVEFDCCTDCRLWAALILEFNLSPGLIAQQLRFLGVGSCSPYDGASLNSRMIHTDKEKLIELRDHLCIIPKFKKSVSVGVRIEASAFERMLIDKLKEEHVFIHEVVERGRVPLSSYDPSVCAGDGVPLVHDIKEMPEFVGNFYLMQSCVFYRQSKIKLLEAGFTLADEIESREYACGLFMRCEAKGKHLLLDAMSVGADWVLPGHVYYIRCPAHEGKCLGLWCTSREGYAIWQMKPGRIAVIKYCPKVTHTLDWAVDNYDNYAFEDVIKDYDKLILMYYIFAVRRQLKERGHIKISVEMMELVSACVVNGYQLNGSNEIAFTIDACSFQISHDGLHVVMGLGETTRALSILYTDPLWKVQALSLIIKLKDKRDTNERKPLNVYEYSRQEVALQRAKANKRLRPENDMKILSKRQKIDVKTTLMKFNEMIERVEVPGYV